jgi:hypothetical protein
MARALRAGAAYFAIVFAIGFVFGTIRTLLVEPITGKAVATLIEAPLILGASYLVAKQLIERFAVAPELAPRLAMGGVAFLMLLGAEAVLAGPLRGWTLSEWISRFATTEGQLSLALFAIFAAIPALISRRLP